MSTKKQVSRHRSVIDVPKVVSRDPRFSSVSAGQVDANLHAQGYKFLPDMLRGEVRELFAAVKSALKAEKTCKLIEKPLYTAEREALEKDLARVRTKLERAEREQRERDVLQKYKREERDKQASGKGAWFMKDGTSRLDGDTGEEETDMQQPRRRIFSSRRASRTWSSAAASARSRRWWTRR